jgi:hypothetical protein
VYESRKMRPVETVSGMEGIRIKENDGGGEVNYGKLVNVTMYPKYNNKNN